ncbi:DUF262 domain-containing protein [Pseudomonas jessenii]|uniref:DUF262 domain-containing protein n=1 Tax=Pseudomonas jessenii TaxID=77298 RepID=UPI0039E026BC
MTEQLKDEHLTLVSGLVTPEIAVASTSVAALLAAESIRGSDGSLIEGRLNIPEYQRPYRWQTKHLQRLLNDLTEYFSPPADATLPQHDFYLGSIIVHKTRESWRHKGQLNIIDGQQRLISMALLAHLLGERTLANGVWLASPESQMRAQQNLQWLKQQALPKVDFSRVNVTLVVTPHEDDAYRFFETQNTGGVRLNGAAILKAHHLRVVPQVDQDNFARRWEAWGDLNGTMDSVMKARHWQALRWRALSSHRQPIQAREEIVTELAESTGRGADVAYRTAKISHFLQDETHQAVMRGYAMRQPLNAGVNVIQYFDYFQQLRRSVLLQRDDGSLQSFHQFYDHLVKRANGSEFLLRLFDCAVLLYVSQFGRQRLMEAGYWLFRVVFAPRLINDKAVRESTAQSFVHKNPVLDWIASSFTHDELVETLKRFECPISNRLDENSVKFRFVRTVQEYFSMPLAKPGEALQDTYDKELKQAIDRMLVKHSLNQVGAL